MADTNDEPSVRRILGNIRRVIAADTTLEQDEDEPDAPVPDFGKVVPTRHLNRSEEAIVELKPAGELLSDGASNATAEAFAKLQALRQPPAEEPPHDTRSVEQLLEDMLRPMLKQWLDENLPGIVGRLVEKEIAKAAKKAELG